MTVQIRLLGEFEVVAASSVSISARKARALFAYLCVRAGRPQQRDHLAHLLWGDVSKEDYARKSLRQALTVLRRELPDALIQSSRDEIWLDQSQTAIDVLDFEKLVQPGAEPGELERAVNLYRGELLEGFRSKAGAYDDWLAGERQRLRERAVGALGQLLKAQHQAGNLAAASSSAIRMVSLDPLHEEAHRCLMRLYAEQGRLGDALDQYDACRQVLERELGQAPSPETQALVEQLRNTRGGYVQAPQATRSEPAAELRVVAVLAIGHVEPLKGKHPASEEVARFIGEQGGSVFRRTSNATLAAFGARRSLGSEATRAASAAMGLAKAYPGTFSLGLSYAQCMVTWSDDVLSVVGDGVSQAANLAAAADAGVIVASESVRQALRGTAALRGLHWTRWSRDQSGAKAWAVQEGADPAGALEELPFVGRVRELSILRAVLTVCQSARTGQLVMIRGEAGIGKTRLIEQTLRLADGEGFEIHRGSATDFGPRAERNVVVQLARSLLGYDLNPHSGWEQVVKEPVSTRDRGLLLELAGVDSSSSPEATDRSEREAREERRRQLWFEMWQQQCQRGPVLICIEDLHWADADAIDGVVTLLPLTSKHPLLLVISTRPEGQPETPGWLGALRGQAVTTLDLGPFNADEARALARQLSVTDTGQVEDALVRSGGHPLFFEQILRAQRPAGLTESVQAAVQARLDQLAAHEAAALRAASVLGLGFDLSTLSELIEGDVPVEGLVRSGLVRSESARFMFSHALVRDAVYESVLPANKRLLHSRAARAVKHIDLALAAEHLARAEDPGAAQAYLEAARDADLHDRVTDALKLVERGLALASDTALTFTLTRVRSRLLRRQGSREAAEKAARDALALAATHVQRARAWVTLADCLRGTPRDAEALSALASAESSAAPDDHRTRSQIQYLKGSVLFPRARADECLAAQEQALHHARLARSTEAQARALSGLGDAYYIKGDLHKAADHFNRCVVLADQLGLARLARVNRVMYRLVQVFLLEDPVGATALILEDAEAAGQDLDLTGEAVARSSALFSLLLQRDYQRLELVARQTLEASRRSGRQRLGLAADACLVEAQIGLGLPIDHEREFDAIYERCMQTEASFAALNVLGVMVAHAKDAKRRTRLLDEADRIIGGGQFVSHGMYQFSRNALAACLDAGELERAQHYIEVLERYTRPYRVCWGEFFCEWARLLSDWKRGTRDEKTRLGLLSYLELAEIRGLAAEAGRIRDALAH